MFQPETEDMLPRAAPKPSTPLASNEAIVRPTVPEVSILFGQPVATTSDATALSATTQPQQTYAAWKKQVLPKVSFPPAGEEVFSINGQSVAANPITTATPLSNVYPLRTMTATIPPMVSSATATTASNNNTNDTQYRRNLDNAEVYAAPTTTPVQWHARQRRSLDIATLAAAAERQQDVLTICAGTQTDNCAATSQVPGIDEVLRKLASKQDFEQLLTLVQSMRSEQLRWMQLCEMLVVQQREQLGCRTYVRDVGTQCKGASPVATNVQTGCALPQRRIVNECEEHVEEEEENREPLPQPFAANNPFQPLFQYQSPRSAPAAQSTAYHAQTPTRTHPQTASKVLSRPATEKSMAMNELALKYLPSEKLTELLDELNIAAATTTAQSAAIPTQPLRNIENMEKGPSDISNASYKYLKKYRLLPEEHDGVGGGRDYAEQQLPAATADQHSPLTARKTQSPYQRAPSPLVAGTSAPRAQHQLLDLDHIRRQPKFL